MHIFINISSIDPDLPHDDTCVFDGGEHEFIKRASYTAYEFAMQRHKNFVDDKAKKRVYLKGKDASPIFVSKICDGVKKSPFTKRAIKDGYDASLRFAAQRQKG